MKVGIPKEIKQGESRVGMTPAGVSEFVNFDSAHDGRGLCRFGHDCESQGTHRP